MLSHLRNTASTSKLAQWILKGFIFVLIQRYLQSQQLYTYIGSFLIYENRLLLVYLPLPSDFRLRLRQNVRLIIIMLSLVRTVCSGPGYIPNPGYTGISFSETLFPQLSTSYRLSYFEDIRVRGTETLDFELNIYLTPFLDEQKLHGSC